MSKFRLANAKSELELRRPQKPRWELKTLEKQLRDNERRKSLMRARAQGNAFSKNNLLKLKRSTSVPSRMDTSKARWELKDLKQQIKDEERRARLSHARAMANSYSRMNLNSSRSQSIVSRSFSAR